MSWPHIDETDHRIFRIQYLNSVPIPDMDYVFFSLMSKTIIEQRVSINHHAKLGVGVFISIFNDS